MASWILDITKERVKQDEQWGGPDQDDLRKEPEWFQYINKQVNQYYDFSGNARERLVKIAALAVAAIEAIDRKAQ